jgi:histidine triad (HIT) family protein
MSSIFSKIIAGEIPCYKVAEDEKNFAFLDIRPLRRGHTLVIPKIEVDHLLDLEPERHASIWAFAQKVGLAIRETMPGQRVADVVLGMEVPHAHIHLIPIDRESDIRFDRGHLEFSSDEMKVIAETIAAAL